jgi:transcriptional regulator GlxA family with amidase domain
MPTGSDGGRNRPGVVLAATPESGDHGRMTRATGPRRIVLLAFDRFQALDLVGPAEVFSMASRLEDGAYATEVVSAQRGEISSSSGLHLRPDRSLSACRGPIDTLVVVGGEGVPVALRDPGLVRWIARAAPRCRRIASVCNGAFLIAEAGLLDGRRATTHWAACETLAGRHPEIEVEPDAIFVKDGDVYTSAGVTAGMDLSLALVEEDLGRRAALEVARWLVLFLKRPGGQSQFSAQLSAQVAEREPLRELQAWIADNLDADLSAPALAARMCLSERHFARVFKQETGASPAAYVEAARTEAARRLLETTDRSVEQIARDAGFGTIETLQRSFRRRVRTSPRDYRRLFSRRPTGGSTHVPV